MNITNMFEWNQRRQDPRETDPVINLARKRAAYDKARREYEQALEQYRRLIDHKVVH